jgi:hypothetical protein
MDRFIRAMRPKTDRASVIEAALEDYLKAAG